MDGFDATRRIRTEMPESKRRIPIIGVSAGGFQEEVARSMAAGMDDFVLKPINFDLLRERILKWAGRTLPSAAIEKLDPGQFDRESLGKLLELDPEGQTLRGFIQIFLSQAPTRIQTIAEALGRGDLEGVSREAHTLKSSCAYLGLKQLRPLCESLEEQAILGQAGTCARIFAEFRGHFGPLALKLGGI
jgi:HPt (histidine-containing phosphotransfer) domain-containing protein